MSSAAFALLQECGSSAEAPRESVRMDCYMSASLNNESPAPGWMRALRDELTTLSNRSSALARSTWAQRSALLSVFDATQRSIGWHLTTQERLFRHLRSIWPDDQPRIMVDLGCQAGHFVDGGGGTRPPNVSDALLWLDYFNSSGDVLGVDLFQDYSLDLAHRMREVHPYRTLSSVNRRAVTLAMALDDDRVDNYYMMIKHHVHCCAGLKTIRPWCGDKFDQHERQGVADHLCRITRQRLGFSPSQLPVPASSYDVDLLNATISGSVSSAKLRYDVKTMRTDTLWRRELGGRRVDFLKIDVDQPWTTIGLEGMLSARAFKVMSIEIDGSWVAWGRHKRWGLARSDQLAWAARHYGYASFIKVPCLARKRHCRYRYDGKSSDGSCRSAWYFPLASPAKPFWPSGATEVTMGHVQDMLIVDAREEGLVDKLVAKAQRSCTGSRARAREARRRERGGRAA